jgi:hypothetical protein
MRIIVKRQITLKHEFVEYIPSILKDETIYVSIPFATATHKCCCGCGHEVVTPISPTDWQLIFDGKSVSLYPSIGNWGFACKSHYWIENNKIKWAPQWSQEKINAGRAHEAFVKQKYFGNAPSQNIPDKRIKEGSEKKNLWERFMKWLS